MPKIANTSCFSKREITVLLLLCLDFTEQETAELLFVSFETVRSHLRNMRERHGVSKTATLFFIAFAKGYIRVKPQPVTLKDLIACCCLN